MYKAIAILILTLTSQISWGNIDTLKTAPQASFTPYKAEYEATYKAGWFPITVEATRELSKLDNGLWELSFAAYSSVADLYEQTQYSIESNTIKPDSYRYRTSGFLSKKRRGQNFEWEEQKVWVTEREEWGNYPLKLGIQDNLSYQEQIRLDLIAGKTEFSYQVAYKNRLKKYDFVVVNRGQTKTKQGLVNTVEVEQKINNKKESTRMWFAADYEYLLIKLKAKEKNGDSNTIILKQAQIKDEVLLGF